jgi:quinohemoprotein ethanol dehydrogenase
MTLWAGHSLWECESSFNMRRGLFVLTALALAGAVSGTEVDNRVLANESDGAQWAGYGRTFSADHFSPLTQINDRNIGRLGLAWSFDLPRSSSSYGAPLAVDGVLYVGVGYSVVRALDAATGKLLWTYDPGVPQVAGHKLRPGWGIRGIAFWRGKVFTGTQDGRLIAIDAKTGRQLWSTLTTEPGDNRYINGPVFAFNGKVVVGQSGADFNPLRGYVTAYDAESGRQVWRFYTVPGKPGTPDPDNAAAMATAAKTWNGEWWRFGGGGGAVWNSMTYDPQFNRLYVGVGQGAPWNEAIRTAGHGDNLFLCSIVALDADTGKYVWHYQVTPGDMWDYDATEDIELTSLPVKGKQRPVLLTASKNGYFYVIDRETGKFVSANNFVRANWADHIDPQTGRPVENPAASYTSGGPTLVFPGPVGGHATQAMSFSPRTHLAYFPATDLGYIYAAPNMDPASWKPKPGMQINAGTGLRPTELVVPPAKSELVAWDPVQQKLVWSAPLLGISNGGTAATAGNLVFQGQLTGEFTAYAANDGRKLWSFDGQAGFQGQPITYLAGRKQYVTVITGYRAVGGFNDPTRTWDYNTQRRRVLTFTLDGQAQLPKPDPPYKPVFVLDEGFTVDPKKATLGASVVGGHCAKCHGGGLVAGGAAPDLRTSAVPVSLQALTTVVHDGALVANGMPRFEELTPEEIEGVQHFIRQRARESAAAAAVAGK